MSAPATPDAGCERIRLAAVRTPDGKVHEDDAHFGAWCRILPSFETGTETMDEAFALMEDAGYTEGFTMSTGRYVSREEALLIARRGKQLKNPSPETDYLCAEDLLD